jgi:outer membrane receptor for Fe3+-dicitrate
MGRAGNGDKTKNEKQMSTRLEKSMRIADEHQHTLVDSDNYHDERVVTEVHVHSSNGMRSTEVSNWGHTGNHWPVADPTTLTYP